ncbi:hypothetical protein [Anaeromyxobacter oryzae]|uniref:hypothetical protein n=1 Tax=Anaeromyxobacter oryzae TaxID=2918170 RepID=UPI0020C0F0B9|nr:hypothetical protein [Anaeromyxobacter oryzae]
MAAVLAALASRPASAQIVGPVDTNAAPGAADRMLAGHVFTPSLLVRSPFAVTAFEADLLYGSGSATGPTYDVHGEVVGDATYSFAATAQSFSYEKKLHEGISAGLGALTQLYSGIDGPSAVVVGAEVQFGAFGRVTAGHRFGPVRAAATFDASYAPRLAIQVFDAIKKALDSGSLETGAALNQSNVWTLKPGLALAWAPFRSLGLITSVDYQWVWLAASGAETQQQSGLDAAIAADLDLGTFTGVPVALLAGYGVTAPLGSNGVSRATSVSGGVFYTGRPALALGVELGRRTFSVRNLDSSALLAQIQLKYHW